MGSYSVKLTGADDFIWKYLTSVEAADFASFMYSDSGVPLTQGMFVSMSRQQ